MTLGPTGRTRYLAAHDIPMLAPSHSSVAAPPGSGSTARTARTRTTVGGELEPELELDFDASFIAKPDVRTSRSDLSGAKLKLYHEACNKRLEHTLHVFREREERDRVSISRGAKKQRVGIGSTSTDHHSSAAATNDRQWKLIRESNDVRVFRHIRRKQRASTVMASGTIHGSLSDVMNGLYADTTRDAQVLHTLLSTKFIDASVLHVDRHGDDDHEPFQFSGITWTALKTPGLFFCKNRDLLCFKKMDVFKDDFGDEFGYLVLQSIEPTDECTKSVRSSSTRRFVRGYISIGVLFKRLDDDRVRLFAHGEFNPKGRIVSALGDMCFANSIVALANTAQSGQAKNLSMLLHSYSPAAASAIAAQATPPTPTSTLTKRTSKKRDHCSVCARSMFFWDAPTHCRGCLQRTCRACRVKRPIFCAQAHGLQHVSVTNSGSGNMNIGYSGDGHYNRRKPTKPKKPQAPCTETFCLQCVATVVPSGVQTRAKLLQQLAKKRKRSSGSHGQRQTLSSSLADSSAVRAAAGQTAALDDRSSISANSFDGSESRKLLTRRSLRARPSSMVDVVERFATQQQQQQQQQRGPYGGMSGAKSSSMPSLISYSSNDTGAALSDYDSASLIVASETLSVTARPTTAARPSDFRLGSRQYHMDVLAAGLQRDRAWGTAAAAALPRAGAQPARTDEYYQKVLQRYLGSNRSYISMNSNLSSTTHQALTDREDVSTVRSVVDSVSTGSSASIAATDLYFKRL